MPATDAPDPLHAEAVLEIVRGLAREMRPDALALAQGGLDDALERDFCLDSLARVELFNRIERELGLRLPESALSEAETPRDLLRLLAGAERSGGPATNGTDPPAQATAVDLAPLSTEFPSVTAPPPESIATLTEMLDWHVAHHGERVHITLYGEGEKGADISYRLLQGKAQAVAGGLLAKGVRRGERIAIMLPTGLDFLAAFYGALYAACVPVPMYPPARPAQLEEHMRRIAGIVANAEAAVLITDPRAKLVGHLLRAQCVSLRQVATVTELNLPGPLPPPGAGAQDIAFLQYTSGSTGDPKGVMLTHANLFANLRAMEQATAITAEDVFVSWLPLYHDMGLIGACFGSLVVGFRLVLMSPLAFLAKPRRWLEAIHRHRATVSAAPNFAYDLCAKKFDDGALAGLDLSCWRLAFNGAEPISPHALEDFAARLAPQGFRPQAMTPVYGLAESSVGLAFPPLGRGPLIDCVDRQALAKGLARPAQGDVASVRQIVSCGRALPGHALRIVDATGNELPERTQGRVQFRGPSATSGYYRKPEATARLVDGEWLNTGDLGYLVGGELFLTGREKDIIIRGGRNIHPQELEEAVSGVAGVRRGGVAAFPAADPRTGTERLVVLAETRELRAEARSRIQAEINRLAVDLIGLPADDVVLVPPRTVLRTSSGKIRRAACRAFYESGASYDGPTAGAPWRQVLALGWSGLRAGAARGFGPGLERVWSLWAWTVFVVVVALAWVSIVLAPTLVLRRRVARASARLAVALTGLSPRVDGVEKIPSHGAHIVVANHASYLDALILTAVLPPRFAFVGKQELLKNPFAALPLRRLEAAFVERFDSARSVEDSRALVARAARGDALVFFPEGTFRDAPGLLPFRMGAFVVAASTGAPVIPLTLVGTRSLLPGESLRPRFSALRVLVGAPLHTQGEVTDTWRAAVDLREAARAAIAAQLGEADAAFDER